MTDEELKLLVDIKTAIEGIDEHLQGKRDFLIYQSNKTIRRAVERELEIIGEAVSKLNKINSIIPISYKRLIIDLRNKVIHAYDNVNNIIIWKVVTKDIPVLLIEVEQLLQNKKQ